MDDPTNEPTHYSARQPTRERDNYAAKHSTQLLATTQTITYQAKQTLNYVHKEPQPHQVNLTGKQPRHDDRKHKPAAIHYMSNVSIEEWHENRQH